jgi:two-component system, chemotaxis family, protein-glutamate methylesterase/glutaminase
MRRWISVRSFTAELGKSKVGKGATEQESREVRGQESKGAWEQKTIGDVLNYFLPCTFIFRLRDPDKSLPSCSFAVPHEPKHLTEEDAGTPGRGDTERIGFPRYAGCVTPFGVSVQGSESPTASSIQSLEVRQGLRPRLTSVCAPPLSPSGRLPLWASLNPRLERGMSPERSYKVGFRGSKLDEIALGRRGDTGKNNLCFSRSPFRFCLLGVISIFDPNLVQMLSADPSLSPLSSIPNVRPEIIVIGTSLGGLHALEVLLAGLPKNLQVPVAIAQHRHKDSDNSLCVFLQAQCALPIKEAEDKEAIMPGCIYLAPADYHLLVEAGDLREDWQSKHQAGARHTFALSTEAPVLYARPSINVLFESAAEAYGKKVLGVILTGASNDGTQGLLKIKANGGLAVVQDPTTAASPTMPKAAIAAVAVDWILPLRDIAPLIVNLCHSALR